MVNRKYTIDEARNKIMAYCAVQERCHKEVTDKLYSWSLPGYLVDELIAFLIEQNFLNEERFARSFVRGKFQLKKWGRNKIVVKLKEKRVSARCIQYGLTEIDEDKYQSVLRQLIDKKSAELKNKNKFERMRRLKNYLIQKGYEWDYIRTEIIE